MLRQLLTLLAPVVLLTACATNAYTGRSQLLLLSEAEEVQMGVQGYQEVTKSEPINTDADLNAPLLRVGRAIAKAADAWRAEQGEAPYDWEFKLIADDETVNAWCMPGGKIAFYTAIYPILDDEAGMAIVMGHEVSHAMLRHGGERVSQNLLTQLGLTAASILAADSEYRDEGLAALGMGVSLGVLLPYSRSHETEADMLGLQLAARAGYDPRAGIGVWERMAAMSEGSRPPEILSTHPDPMNRIANMQGWMPDVLPLFERSRKMPNTKLPNALGRGPKRVTKAQPPAETGGEEPDRPRRRRPR